MAGICLDPDHGYVFVTYAYRDASGILRNGISRLRAQPHTFAGKAQEQRDIGGFLAGDASALSHQIGNCVVHGGFLYVSIGDGGNPALSAKLESSLGKVLRLTLDGEPAPGNPFASGPGLAPRVFAFGLRNPFGLAFAGERLFAAENGVALDRVLETRRWPQLSLEWSGRFDRDECGRRIRANDRPGPDGARGAGYGRPSTFGSRSFSDRGIERRDRGGGRGRDGLFALG